MIKQRKNFPSDLGSRSHKLLGIIEFNLQLINGATVPNIINEIKAGKTNLTSNFEQINVFISPRVFPMQNSNSAFLVSFLSCITWVKESIEKYITIKIILMLICKNPICRCTRSARIALSDSMNSPAMNDISEKSIDMQKIVFKFALVFEVEVKSAIQ